MVTEFGYSGITGSKFLKLGSGVKTNEGNNFAIMSDMVMSIMLTGDNGVGKTDLLSRFTQNEFSSGNISTIGMDFAFRRVHIDGKTITAQLWDTAAQCRYRAITNAHYRKAVGVIFVYDITNHRTFDNLDKWLKEARNFTGDDVSLMLVGNNANLRHLRHVSSQKARSYAEKNNMSFIETSALDFTHVDLAFQSFLKEIYSKVSQKGLKDDTSGFNLPSVVESMDIGHTETKEKRKRCVVM